MSSLQLTTYDIYRTCYFVGNVGRRCSDSHSLLASEAGKTIALGSYPMAPRKTATAKSRPPARQPTAAACTLYSGYSVGSSACSAHTELGVEKARHYPDTSGTA